ncbi:hypothetical protein KIPB_009590, partial [Kipferlia bialata]|eukprot:g9590.t1
MYLLSPVSILWLCALCVGVSMCSVPDRVLGMARPESYPYTDSDSDALAASDKWAFMSERNASLDGQDLLVYK